MAMSSGAGAVGSLEGSGSWKRKVKQFVGSHLRQVPCLSAVVDALPDKVRFWRRRRYQTLGQDESGDGTEEADLRQNINAMLGKVMVQAAMICMVGITILLFLVGGDSSPPGTEAYETLSGKGSSADMDEIEFKRDAPIVLYIGALELLICGACAQTAATMYTRRRHALRHPKDCEDRQRARYIEVHLEKDAERRGAQLYGLGYRPSSDGLECLLVEEIRTGSLLDLWNAKRRRREQSTPAASVLDVDPAIAGLEAVAGGAPGLGLERVHPGAAVVAVNNITGDVGLMQVELTKADVTLWVRSEVYHPSQLESEVLAEPDAVIVPGGGFDPAPSSEMQHHQQQQQGSEPGPTSYGNSGEVDVEAVEAIVEPTAVPGPLCACVTFEDEEPQILVRWLVCSLLFGWVTLLPVILMQPHEQRPRQHLFRQYLLKPCMLILPFWMFFWLLDCIQILFRHQLIHPFYYFVLVHMVFPAVFAWYLMQLQAADERLVLEQRHSRQAEAEKECGKQQQQPVAVEDPSPTLLREFITLTPVAMIFLGSVAAIPILLASLFTPLKTERSKLAQGFLNMMYAPLIVFQVVFMNLLYHTRFIELPRLYLAAIGLLLSLPCLMVWCFCLMCSSKYGRQDQALVEKQRVERARVVYDAQRQPSRPADAVEDAFADGTPPGSSEAPLSKDLVDLTEARQREWEFIFTA